MVDAVSIRLTSERWTRKLKYKSNMIEIDP